MISILSDAATENRGPPAFSIAVLSRETNASGPSGVENATRWVGLFKSATSMMA